MRFALKNNELVEPAAGLKGICPGCSQAVVAKCGIQRIHHWAHKAKICDSWWEPETEWHRSWKNNFPAVWQEIFLPDVLTGEKHIADVRTSAGLVIEFQHSFINPVERTSREKFYKNMVWIVDGTRLKRDYPRFLKAEKEFGNTDREGVYLVEFLDECFPSSWLASSVPVIFDFKGFGMPDDSQRPSQLYCIFPEQYDYYTHIAVLPRAAFINSVISGEWTSRAAGFREELKKKEIERNRVQKSQQQYRGHRIRYIPILRYKRRRF
jgi:competence protein CoiA